MGILFLSQWIIIQYSRLAFRYKNIRFPISNILAFFFFLISRNVVRVILQRKTMSTFWLKLQGWVKSNTSCFCTGINTVTATYIIHQNKAGLLWITFLFLNIVTVSFNRNGPPSKNSMNFSPVKLCWLFFELFHYCCVHCVCSSLSYFIIAVLTVFAVLWVISLLLCSLLRYWHNVCLSKHFWWDRRDDSVKALNLVSMEGVIKLFTRIRRLSPLPWCLCMFEHCYSEGGHYCLAKFRVFSKRQT